MNSNPTAKANLTEKQLEVLNLIARLRQTNRLTIIVVSHDLGVVAHLCNRIAIMQGGKLLEVLTAEQLRRGDASEAYTRDLVEASRGFTRAENAL